jgi:hypothetical protein
MMDLYADDDEYHVYGGEEQKVSIEAQALDIYDTAQYLPPQYQLDHFEKLQNFAQNDLFSFETCTGLQLTAYVHGITRLVVVRMLLKHSLEKVIETFHLVIKVHKKSHFFELLTNTVSNLLSLCAQYDLEELNQSKNTTLGSVVLNNWSNSFIEVLNEYRDTFPLLFVPVLEEKVQRLAAEFDKICGVFTSTSAQLAQWEFDVNKIIADSDLLLSLCTQSQQEVIIQETMNDFDDHPAEPTKSTRFGFQSSISSTMTPSEDVSNDSVRNTSAVYNSLILDIMVIKCLAFKQLDHSFQVNELLPTISQLSSTIQISSTSSSARLLELFGYYHANCGSWSIAYSLFYDSFSKYNASNLKQAATLSLCYATLASIFSTTTNTSTGGVNPLLTHEATPFLSRAHIGLNGLSQLISGYSKVEHGTFQQGLSEWMDYCKMFVNKCGIRWGKKLGEVLVQILLKKTAQTSDTISLYKLFNSYELFTQFNTSKQELVKNIKNDFDQINYDNFEMFFEDENSNFDSEKNTFYTNNAIDYFSPTSLSNSVKNYYLSELHPELALNIYTLLLNGTFHGIIDDLSHDLFLIARRPPTILSTQQHNSKEIDATQALQYECYGKSLLDLGVKTIVTTQLPNAPILFQSLYCTSGGKKLNHDAYINSIVHTKSLFQSDVDIKKYLYSFCGDYLHAINTNFLTNFTFFGATTTTSTTLSQDGYSVSNVVDNRYLSQNNVLEEVNKKMTSNMAKNLAVNITIDNNNNNNNNNNNSKPMSLKGKEGMDKESGEKVKENREKEKPQIPKLLSTVMGENYDDIDDNSISPFVDGGMYTNEDGDDGKKAKQQSSQPQKVHFMGLISGDLSYNRLLEATLFYTVNSRGDSGSAGGKSDKSDKSEMTDGQHGKKNIENKFDIPSLSSIPFFTQTDSINGLLNMYQNSTRHMQFQALWQNNQLLANSYNLYAKQRISVQTFPYFNSKFLKTNFFTNSKLLNSNNFDNPFKTNFKLLTIWLDKIERYKTQAMLAGPGQSLTSSSGRPQMFKQLSRGRSNYGDMYGGDRPGKGDFDKNDKNERSYQNYQHNEGNNRNDNQKKSLFDDEDDYHPLGNQRMRDNNGSSDNGDDNYNFDRYNDDDDDENYQNNYQNYQNGRDNDQNFNNYDDDDEQNYQNNNMNDQDDYNDNFGGPKRRHYEQMHNSDEQTQKKQKKE